MQSSCGTVSPREALSVFEEQSVRFILEPVHSLLIALIACREGFMTVMSKSDTMKLLSTIELQKLICGTEDLDFGALESVTKYQGGYTKDSEVIRWFWQVLESFTGTCALSPSLVPWSLDTRTLGA